MLLLIRRMGTVIDLSPDGYAPLPEQIVEFLRPHLEYDYKLLLRGHAAYDSVTGGRAGVEVTTRQLFSLEEGRLVTGYGFIPKLARLLTQAGHDVRYQDWSPTRVRPSCYIPDWDNVTRHGIQFRPRQLECVQAIVNNEGGVVVAPTGFGKTFCLYVLSLLYPHAKIAVVIKSVEVAERIVRRLSASLANVGFVGGGHKQAGRLTVYTADSMHHCNGDVDFLLADEAHQLLAPRLSETLASTFFRTRNYAFTATPTGRLDGADPKMEMLFGPPIFQMTYAEGVELGLVVPIFVRWLPIMLDRNPAYERSGVPKLRWGIWRNQERNHILAQDARTQYPEGTQILINVATIDHAIHLWQMLPEFALCYADFDPQDCERYIRNNLLPQSFRIVTPEIRFNMQREFEAKRLQRVIATDVWSTGVDFEQLQVFYNISARESEIFNTQGPGRVSRIFEGKPYGEVVDAIDYFDTGLYRKAESRKRNYRRLGWADDWPTGRRQVTLL